MLARANIPAAALIEVDKKVITLSEDVKRVGEYETGVNNLNFASCDRLLFRTFET